MAKTHFEHNGNNGTLSLVTHFGEQFHISCSKKTDEQFRMGGTAVDDVLVYEAILLSPEGKFRAFKSSKSEDFFEGECLVSPEYWPENDSHGYITEYYPLDMEGTSSGWFISRKPIEGANCIFINIDVIDGGGNIMKRYRISPFTGDFKIL